jgi:hypothetical protein
MQMRTALMIIDLSEFIEEQYRERVKHVMFMSHTLAVLLIV